MGDPEQDGAMSGWLIAGLAVAFFAAAVVALRLWGAQIAAGLVRIAAQAALDTLEADRMSEAEEAAWRDCQRRGGKWDARKKRCVEPR
jgi:hypothetical protein